ncbi:MAG: MFS transporter [Candidatus Saccharibacteria bacterium]|nr:MFS transporter [Microbacteriaceae bacterium]
MQALLAARPAVDIVYFSGQSFVDPGCEADYLPDYRRGIERTFSSGVEATGAMLLRGTCFASPCLYLSRRSLWGGGEGEGGGALAFLPIVHEDEEILTRLTCGAGVSVCVDTVFFQRRIRAGSTMTQMLVALALPRVLDRFADRRVMLLGCAVLPIGLVALALVVLAPATVVTWSGLLVIWFVLGAATALILTPSARLLRRSSNETTRPAVFAAQFSLSHACFIVTYPLAGVLGALLGLAPTALLLAALGTAAAVTAARVWTPSAPVRDTESPAVTA